jgi:hypothetical protein
MDRHTAYDRLSMRCLETGTVLACLLLCSGAVCSDGARAPLAKRTAAESALARPRIDSMLRRAVPRRAPNFVGTIVSIDDEGRLRRVSIEYGPRSQASLGRARVVVMAREGIVWSQNGQPLSPDSLVRGDAVAVWTVPWALELPIDPPERPLEAIMRFEMPRSSPQGSSDQDGRSTPSSRASSRQLPPCYADTRDSERSSESSISRSAAATFSSKWLTLEVPGMGSMTGDFRSSHASATCAGVALS